MLPVSNATSAITSTPEPVGERFRYNLEPRNCAETLQTLDYRVPFGFAGCGLGCGAAVLTTCAMPTASGFTPAIGVICCSFGEIVLGGVMGCGAGAAIEHGCRRANAHTREEELNVLQPQVREFPFPDEQPPPYNLQPPAYDQLSLRNDPPPAYEQIAPISEQPPSYEVTTSQPQSSFTVEAPIVFSELRATAS